MNRTIALFAFLASTSCSVHVGSPPQPQPVVHHPVVFRHAVGRAHVTRAATRPAADTSSVEQLCVDEINRYRATLGLRALARAADRESCADGQIADDASSGHWHGRFGACQEGAQNECMSSPIGRADMIKGCLHGMWNEGPGGGHYENMKSASATQVWCGFTTRPNGDVWAVQDFR